MDQRKEFVKRIKELQPEVSNRAIAGALGVGKGTIDRDVRGPNGPQKAEKPSSVAQMVRHLTALRPKKMGRPTTENHLPARRTADATRIWRRDRREEKRLAKGTRSQLRGKKRGTSKGLRKGKGSSGGVSEAPPEEKTLDDYGIDKALAKQMRAAERMTSEQREAHAAKAARLAVASVEDGKAVIAERERSATPRRSKSAPKARQSWRKS